MNKKFNHSYYESTTPNFIRETFNNYNIYTFDNICCLYINISIDMIRNYNHILYKKIKEKIYNKLIKCLCGDTICFSDKDNCLIIYLYDIDMSILEMNFIEFYEFINKIQIPVKDKLLNINVKTGIYYSLICKDPIELLDNAFKQYRNTCDKDSFLSIKKVI